MPTALQFVHRFEPARRPQARPLLLLHGTGGNEDDLLSIGQIISPGAASFVPAQPGARKTACRRFSAA
jgi:Predicted esterase